MKVIRDSFKIYSKDYLSFDLAIVTYLHCDKWSDGPHIYWFDCDGLLFGMMIGQKGKYKNVVGMCNHQGISIEGIDYYDNEVGMYCAALRMLDKCIKIEAGK